MGSGTHAVDRLPRPRLGTTLRRALAAWWDRLGLSCAISAAVTLSAMGLVAACQSIGLFRPSAQPGGLMVVVLLTLLFGAWVASGLHTIAFAVVSPGDEPSFSDLLRVHRTRLWQAVLLLFVQVAVAMGCFANIAFYVSWRSTVGTMLAVVFGYAFLVWTMTCAYHWPLLAAAYAGAIPLAGGSRPSLRGVLRNGLVLTLAAPAYTAGLVLVEALIVILLTLSGIGLVLVVPAIWSILGAQAVRDHLVARGMLPPPPEGSVPPDEWHVPQE